MKLRPAEQASRTSCVRCTQAFTEAGGRVRALCSRCDYQLQELHYVSEYVLYGKTYYQCSPEGTTHQWLCNNFGYIKDIHLPRGPLLRGTKLPFDLSENEQRAQYGGLNLQPLFPKADNPPPLKPPWTIDEAFARTMRAGRQLYANYHRNEDIKAQAKRARIAEGKGSEHATWAEREGYPTLRYRPPAKKVGGQVQEVPA